MKVFMERKGGKCEDRRQKEKEKGEQGGEGERTETDGRETKGNSKKGERERGERKWGGEKEEPELTCGSGQV